MGSRAQTLGRIFGLCYMARFNAKAAAEVAGDAEPYRRWFMEIYELLEEVAELEAEYGIRRTQNDEEKSTET